MAATFGNQAQKVVAEARQRAQRQEHRPEETNRAKEAISYARASNFEREAVTDERTILRDALRRGMGETTYAQVRAEFDARQRRGDFRQTEGKKHDTGRSFTTPETIAQERANVAHVMRGQNTFEPLMTAQQATAQAGARAFLRCRPHFEGRPPLQSRLACLSKHNDLRLRPRFCPREGSRREGSLAKRRAACTRQIH